MLLLIVLFMLVMVIMIEIGVFLTSDDFKGFVFTSVFIFFDICLFAIAILSIWSECQL